MSGDSTSPTAPPSSNSATPRKGHNKRESSGHVCTACDQCYRCKVRCSGDRPVCERCRTNKSACTYSTGKPLGKPKGSKNKVQRSKSTTDIPRPPIAPANAAPSDWIRSPPLKRLHDGDLPPSKRTSLDPLVAEVPSHLPAQALPSPTTNSSELPSLAPGILRPEAANGLVHEPLPYYVDANGHHDTTAVTAAALLGDHHADISSKIDDVFPSSDLNLEIDDFHWFTHVGGTPTAAPVDLHTTNDVLPAIPASSVSSQALLPPAAPASTAAPTSTAPSQHDAVALDASTPDMQSSLTICRPPPPASHSQQSLPCLCDPLSLGIISELHTLQLSLSPLDTALILARRGLTTVSSYLSCPSCLSRLSNSPSLFLACILILQQVFACYLTVRLQGTKMLQATLKNETHETEKCHNSVSIGEFEVEGEESCNGVLDAIVKAEMDKGRGIIGGLERWIEKAGEGRERVAGMLLRSLKEEIGFPAAC